ncbi:MAG: Ig-like domain-containing protein [Flexilinea sp.]|nr:Ig-like domain-containing protein [Flexilinea sp.]
MNGKNGNVNNNGNNVKNAFGVRPALKLNLSSVIFSSDSQTFSLPKPVTSITLSPATATLTVGGEPVKLTAIVTPSDATDGTVKWSVTGAAVKLYSDANCTTEIGTDATETLTVYAKGISAGSATVTATSNADATKSASCAVTVNKGTPIANAPTGLTATYGQTLANVTLTNPTGNTAGTWAWVDSATSVGTVGDHTFKANFTPMDTTNYNSKSNVDVTVTIAPKPAQQYTVTVNNGSGDGSYIEGAEVAIKANDPAEGMVFDKWTSDDGIAFANANTAQTSFEMPAKNVTVTAVYKDKEKEESMEWPVEITNVQGSGAKGVPDDVKEQTIRLTIQVSKDGELKTSSETIELEVTPGGNKAPNTLPAVKFTPVIKDFAATFGNYEQPKATVSPSRVKANIYGAGDDGPSYTLSAVAGFTGQKFTVTLFWNGDSKPAEEVIAVYALPEDEVGAYRLNDDGTKEYLLFQTYDICMRYLGRDDLCRGYERCFHKESPFVNPFVK